MKSNFNIAEFVKLKNQNVEYIQTPAMQSAYENIEKVLDKKMDLLRKAKTQKDKEGIFAKSKIEIPKELTEEDFKYLKNVYQAAGFNKIEYIREEILDIKTTIPSSLVKFNDDMYVEIPAKKKFYYKYFITLS